MVKHDGTVQIVVPGDIKPHPSVNGTGVIDGDHGESFKETLIQEIQPVRPLQIAMLIVGTRGDVQPFVAIGKRLQVFFILDFLCSCFYTMMIVYLKNTCSDIHIFAP